MTRARSRPRTRPTRPARRAPASGSRGGVAPERGAKQVHDRGDLRDPQEPGEAKVDQPADEPAEGELERIDDDSDESTGTRRDDCVRAGQDGPKRGPGDRAAHREERDRAQQRADLQRRNAPVEEDDERRRFEPVSYTHLTL